MWLFSVPSSSNSIPSSAVITDSISPPLPLGKERKSSTEQQQEQLGLSHSRSLGDIASKNNRIIVCGAHTDAMDMDNSLLRMADLYSSRDYVRHSNNGTSNSNCFVPPCSRNPPSPLPHQQQFLCSNHRSLECLHSSSCCSSSAATAAVVAPSPPQSLCCSTGGGRISCPPPRRHVPPPPKQQQFALIIDPLRPNRTREDSGSTGGGGGGMLRCRTKSLDNGLMLGNNNKSSASKLSLAGLTQQGWHNGGKKEKDGSRTSSSRCSEQQQQRESGGQRRSAAENWPSSRLDQAKQFLRRFYASSTLRLAVHRRKKRKNSGGGQSANSLSVAGGGKGALLFSSAVGPFYELRRPCPEELPFLPYNIHYAVDDSGGGSADECSGDEEDNDIGGSQTTDRDTGTATMASSVVIIVPGQEEEEEEEGEEEEDEEEEDEEEENAAASGTLTPAVDGGGWMLRTGDGTERTPSPNSQAMGADGNRQFSAASATSPDSAVDTFPRPPPPPALPSTAPAVLTTTTSVAADDVSSPSSQPTAANTPSAGYGSLKSFSDSEGKKGGSCDVATAERRFADWNELFQYLRREIIEMNVRDAQILRSLENIQFELNGVRRMASALGRR